MDTIVPNFGTASLSFAPTGDFIASLRPQLNDHLSASDKSPLDTRTIAVFPRCSGSALTIFTYFFDGSRQVDAQICPIDIDSVSSDIGLVFQQILRATHPRLDFDLLAFVQSNLNTPFLLEFLLEVGVAFAQTQEFEAARSVWTQALEQFPDSSSALGNIGQSYSDQGRYDEAEDWFTTAIARTNDIESLILPHWNRGIARSELGKWSDALIDFEAVIQFDPCFGWAFINAANCLINLGDLNRANLMYRRCLALRVDTSGQFSGDKSAKDIAQVKLRDVV